MKQVQKDSTGEPQRSESIQAKESSSRPALKGGYAVQREALRPGAGTYERQQDALKPAGAHELATEGTRGASGSLPHLDRIQASFGGHDVTGAKAAVGGEAARASEGLGAQAFAYGNAIAFREAPDLHTTAHEAAHVVQQRAGVQLKGGVGAAGDAYEQHADAVADTVVSGGSAETLLSQLAGGGGGAAVQRKATADGCAGGLDAAEGATASSDAPPVNAASEADLNARGEAALAKLKAAANEKTTDKSKAISHGEGKTIEGFPAWFMEIQGILSRATEWGPEAEEAQLALRDYAIFATTKNGGQITGNAAAFLSYLGRGQSSNVSAAKGGYKTSSGLGGNVSSTGKKDKNWCSYSSTIAVQMGLAEMGLKFKYGFPAWVTGAQQRGKPSVGVAGKDAVKAPLRAGDRVSYLYDGCQGGGHAVTIIEDRGASFLHASGNTGGVGTVALAESKRWLDDALPKGLDLSKSSPSPKFTKDMTAGEIDAENLRAIAVSSAHTRSVNFDGKALVYSITRVSDVFAELEQLKLVDPAQDPKGYQAVLDRLGLQRVAPAVKPAAK